MAENDAGADTLASLSAKLADLSTTLPADEQVALKALIALAGEQLNADDDVEGFALTTQVKFGDVGAFKQGFATSFGPLVTPQPTTNLPKGLGSVGFMTWG